ncbi:hypothetical protein CFC21_094998 [Triticum aestivum]|uniref:NB-ARC domain-containing protein n=2 Tax=Triticum aestivum TaxID=4565 RepID=A0A9R1LPF7_WHEAT|nr:disease resistance protein RGA4-like [Triticum aestivum]KAF7092521.1 hypothetical protein CFC21_094998 [Triticum aestivum]
MEAVAAAAATSFVEWMVPKLFDFLHANHELRKNLKNDIIYIKHEFAMISAVIKDDDSRGGCRSSSEEAHTVWINIVRDLAHAIEDCIDRFMHSVTMADSEKGRLSQAVHRVKTVKARSKFAAEIRTLKNRSEDASKLREKYSNNNSSNSSPRWSLSSEQTDAPTAVQDDDDDTHSSASIGVPVGIDGPRGELMDLIQQEQQLKVITIVGFHGMGKTLLANHVYNSKAIESQYEVRAWVLGGRRTAANVLKEILQQLGHLPLPTNGSLTLTLLHASIRECIGNKRFFIVIDDLRTTAYWHNIKAAFVGLTGRFLVTTVIQPIANICRSSSVSDHVYTMATLTDQDSRILFFKEAFQDDEPLQHVDDLGSAALKKCDGLPLALVTTARFLQSAGNPTPMIWAKLCADLGTHLKSDDLFARMRRVLVQSYTSLDSQVARTFLLYLSTYPSGRPIKKSSLLRRWLAEGLSPGDNRCSDVDAPISNFKKLVDRSIIQPMDATGNTEVKTCHTHGMMLEFILHKSTSDNFVTVLYDGQSTPRLPSNIRRLALHHARPREVQGLTLVRSLTILGEAHPSVLDFSKYELLRVLDLEECVVPLEDGHLKFICRKLLLLRYLCLGKAVIATVLPKEISKLQLLDTLDVRNTPIEILPTQVLELPHLLHLFGKFKLKQDVGGRRMSKLQTWLSMKSRLETLAGFVVDSAKSQEFAQLMDHMNYLTKVKIWCESTADVSSSSHLAKAIKGFIERSTEFKGTTSLSLSFEGGLTQDMLNSSLEKGKNSCCYLGSLKLQGSKICSLPRFVALLGGLTKLGLSSPHLSLSQDFLAAVDNVPGLAYLKLVATSLDKLVITKGILKRLGRLSIVVDSMIGQLEIQEGALPCLKSLQLLCKDLVASISGTSLVQSLGHLKEIALHREVGDETKQEWTEAAKNLPSPRPKILFL